VSTLDAARQIANWARHEQGERALGRVAEMLGAMGCPVVPVKGVVLAHWIYDDVAERPMADVDLLVPAALFEKGCRRVRENGWAIAGQSIELGELTFDVDGMTVELHSYIGRRELTTMSVDDVIGRSTVDTTTFPFEIRRIDDVDHLLLLATNVVKDYFAGANPHQPEDLHRMLVRVEGRTCEIVDRAQSVGFFTGLHNTASWMATSGRWPEWERLLAAMGPARRSVYAAAVRAHRTMDKPNRILGLLLACWANDRLGTRAAAVGRIAKRGVIRNFGMAR
jgi:hypothetical protein